MIWIMEASDGFRNGWDRHGTGAPAYSEKGRYDIMESYVECMVARRPSAAMKALKIALIAIAVIGFILGASGLIVFLIVAAAAAVGAYFAGLHSSLEYEYLYVDREITVDKILNKTRRKRVERFEVDRIEIMAPIHSWHLDSYKNREYKVTDYSCGVEEKPDLRYAVIYDGGRKIIFQPSIAMVKAIQSVAPRKVFSD